ncbi:MAG: amidohydrolase [Planctomycetaceae bacterium]
MDQSAADRVRRSQDVLAHAWMVRTFVKHCDEAEDFPELMQLPRTVFDLCRAVEHLIDRPEEYLRILKKKLARLRKGVEQFEHDAPLASTHTNFQQAAISIRACYQELLDLTAIGGHNESGSPTGEAHSPVSEDGHADVAHDDD